MSIAVLADLHGNLVACEAVLADLATRSVDALICLGDVAATGPQPHEVVERLRDLHCPVVMGNTDAWLLDPPEAPTDTEADETTRRIKAVDRWCAERLTADDRAFLATFQPTVVLDLGHAKRLLCYHGSPLSFHDQITPTTPTDDLDRWLAGTRADLYAGGHTHQQMARRHRGSVLLNPGSVGLPYDPLFPTADAKNPAWAEYAIVECGARGALGVELRRVPFALDALLAAFRASGMPHADWLAADWVE